MGAREGKGGKSWTRHGLLTWTEEGWYGGERNIAVCFCVAVHPGMCE